MIKLFEEFINESREYEDMTDKKEEFLKDIEITKLVGWKNLKFVKDSKTKIFVNQFAYVITDGKREIHITKLSPRSISKRLGNASKQTKELYNK